MKRIHYLIIILQLFVFCGSTLHAQIRLRLPSLTTTAGQAIDVPVIADSSLMGKGVLSYTLDITYSDYYLYPTSVLTTGTISDAFGSPAVNIQNGRITIAGAGSSPLTGDIGDTLVIIRFNALAYGGTSLTFSSSATNFFNEGTPNMSFTNGYVTIIQAPSITITPSSGIVLRGETIAFSVNGSGTQPYTWEVLNSNVGDINQTGLFTATNVGLTKIKVTDNASLTTQTTGNIEVRGYRLSIPNNLSEWQGGEVVAPINVTNLDGLGVVSGNLSLSYNANILTPIQIITAGTLLESFGSPTINFGNGKIDVSFAGTSPLAGSGTLLFVKFEISSVNQGGSSLDLSNIVFNENLLSITQNGYFSTINLADISITPNSLTMIAGQSQTLVATNGVEPYTWSVDNSNSASIDQDGKLTAIKSGKVYVTVTDNVGAKKTSGVYTIFDTEVYFPDTVSLGLTTFDIPLFINEFPLSQSVSAIDATIQFQSPELEFVQIVSEGTLSQGWTYASSLNGNTLKFAGAGSNSFTSGSFTDKAPVVKLRFQLTAEHTLGETAFLNILELVFNEGIPFVKTDNGGIKVVDDFNLQLLANPDNIGAVLTGSGIYMETAKTIITADVPAGYNFVNWTGSSSDVALLGNPLSQTTSFTMPARDVVFTANYQSIIPKYSLTLIANPSEGGSVIGSGDYEEGAIASITATPNSGYMFVNWTDASSNVVSTNASFTYTMPALDVTLTANFEVEPPPTYTLELVANPSGTGTLTGAGEYQEGEAVTITAAANSGYVFVNWTDATANVVSTNASYSYTMPALDVTLTANFEAETQPKYSLILEANPSGTGTITGAGEYQEGEVIAITAVSNSGYLFVSWTDEGANVVSTNANFSYTMPGADATLTANFEQISYSVSILVTPTLSGSVSGDGTFTFGENVTLLATSNSGYSFLNWQLGGTVISTSNPYTFSMPAENINLTAHFIADGSTLYTLALNENPMGAGSVSGAGSYEAGSNIQLTANANSGYTFLNWTDASANIVSTSATFTYTMPIANTTLTANFEVLTAPKYMLDLDVSPSGSGVTSGSEEYTEGTVVQISATANTGYFFVNWTDANSNIVSTSANFSYTMPANDVTLTANFDLVDYNVSVNITPTLAGSTTGAGSYNLGDEVTLLATPNANFTFLNWQIDGTAISSSNPYAFSMPAENLNITAHFVANGTQLYTLTLNVNPSIGGTANGGGSFEAGTNVLLTATANSGYNFKNWTDESNAEVSNLTSFTYTMPSSNVIFTANFEEEIVQQGQSITFGSLPVKTYGDGTFSLFATASSGLLVSYSSSNPNVATISGNIVTIIGAGTTTITASQDGNQDYLAATPVDQLLTVLKADQLITFSAIPNKLVTDAPFILEATSTSGLMPTYISSNNSVATIIGNTVTIVGAGTTTITASQVGDNNYNAAQNVQQTLVVNKLSQIISFNVIPDQQDNGGSVNLTATASSGLPVVYQVTGPVSLNNSVLTITGAGKVTVIATQPGNNTYLAATDVNQEFCVNPLPVITKQTGTTTQFELVSNYLTGNQWIKDGSDITGATSTVYQVLQSGLYRLRVTVDGCVGTSQNVDVTLTSIEQSTLFEILRIYPNPTTGLLYLDANQVTDIYIYDVKGRLVLVQKALDKYVDVSNLPNGFYTIKASYEGEVKTAKFIKR